MEIQVIPSPSPEIALSGESSICEGESVTLSADPSATGIEWYLDGVLLGENGAEIEAQEGGTYYAILSNEACTIQTESVEVQVIPYPNPEIAISGETSFCEGESATLSVDPLATAVEWYLDGVLLAGEEPNIEVQDAGTYYAILSNQDCSIQTISVEIQVIPSPSLEIALSGEASICEGESVTLSADPSATGIAWYLDGELLGEKGLRSRHRRRDVLRHPVQRGMHHSERIGGDTGHSLSKPGDRYFQAKRPFVREKVSYSTSTPLRMP
ncbi:MAG: hypothetical protein IPJ00_20745 [Saprospirales bacterium]|nr:hypothetical protein [Saprospirales bacterium]